MFALVESDGGRSRTVGILRWLVALGAIVGMPAFVHAAENRSDFKMAVVGLAHAHAWPHLRSIAQRTDLRLVGVADESEVLRSEAAKEAPRATLYSDYTKLLEEEKPDAVWSFVESDRHVEITQACARKGVHLIFEKPMASTLDQARRMADLVKKHGILLMINYQMAWWPANSTAYEIAKSGQLGRVWRVHGIIGHGGPGPRGPEDHRRQAFWAWLNDESRGGGALMDFTSYGAVWLRWYLGMPSSVYAVTTHTRPETYNTNTNATVLAAFPDNRVGIIEGSWDLPRAFQDVEVFGSRGSVSMNRTTVEMYIGRDKKEVSVGQLDPVNSDPVSYLMYAVRARKPIEGIVGADFNVDVMEIVEAARLSAASGKPVELPARRRGELEP
ncbi:MAG: Gfo/Idh/MocA family protein [Acidobacteriota bacterium]